MDVLSSAPVTLWADFEAPQGLVIPDVGSVTFSLYDGTGAPLAVDQALTPEAEATGVSISIRSIHNVLVPGHDFERRQVLLNWTAEGRSFSKRLAYRVTELLPHNVTPTDVRTYLAINEDELRDDEVDIFSATLTVEGLMGRDRFRAALNSGTRLALRAERAVVLAAATVLFPSLRYRIAQSKKDDALQFDRIKDASAFDALVGATADELAGIVAEVTGTASTEATIPFVFGVAGPTIDPITGVAPVAAGA